MAAALRTAIDEAERRLRPVDLIAFGRELDRTMALWNVPADWERVSEFYFEAMADLPHDLAMASLGRARRSCRFRPLPADLRLLVADDFARRRLRLARLRVAHLKALRLAGRAPAAGQGKP